jgi:steroid 5-alpha reductase family enzyme
MMKDLSILLGAGFGILFIFMCLIWLVQRITKNAGLVDSFWAFSFPILASIYLVITDQYGPRQWALYIIIVCWGVRLGLHLYERNAKGPEDSRYAVLRESWGKNTNRNMFLFFQFQALLAAVLSIPFALVSMDPQTELSIFNLAGLAIGLIAFSGEWIADHQLRVFKQSSSNKGKVLQAGLWGHSRHPNYFFEWLMWLAFFVYALSSPWGWISVLGVGLMYHFLTKVTGIAATEEQMLRSRGEPYRIYRQQTPAFFPGLKNRNKI